MSLLEGRRIGYIAIDLRSACYYPGHGIGTYTAELFRAMPGACAGYSILGDSLGRLYEPGEQVEDAGLRHPFAAAQPCGEGCRPDAGSFWELASQPQVLGGGEVLWHNPHNGLGAPAPDGSTRLVVTIHDLIPLVMPDKGRQAYTREFSRTVPGVAARASAIITASQHSRDDIVRLLSLPPERVRVIPEAARRACRPLPKAAALAHVTAEFGLADPYVLYVGGFGDRKNVAALVAGFAIAKPHMPKTCRLALVGSPERTYGQVSSLAHRLGCASDVVFTGHVTEADLVTLYSAAAAFVYPSLYEGFGLPPLEAMACGCPVACSDATSLPEVCAGAAVLMNARHPEQIANAIRSIMEDRELAGALVQRGLARAAELTWHQAARATADVYRVSLLGTKETSEG